MLFGSEQGNSKGAADSQGGGGGQLVSAQHGSCRCTSGRIEQSERPKMPIVGKGLSGEIGAEIRPAERRISGEQNRARTVCDEDRPPWYREARAPRQPVTCF